MVRSWLFVRVAGRVNHPALARIVYQACFSCVPLQFLPQRYVTDYSKATRCRQSILRREQEVLASCFHCLPG
jgi:hypothetical protein